MLVSGFAIVVEGNGAGREGERHDPEPPRGRGGAGGVEYRQEDLLLVKCGEQLRQRGSKPASPLSTPSAGSLEENGAARGSRRSRAVNLNKMSKSDCARHQVLEAQ